MHHSRQAPRNRADPALLAGGVCAIIPRTTGPHGGVAPWSVSWRPATVAIGLSRRDAVCGRVRAVRYGHGPGWLRGPQGPTTTLPCGRDRAPIGVSRSFPRFSAISGFHLRGRPRRTTGPRGGVVPRPVSRRAATVAIGDGAAMRRSGVRVVCVAPRLRGTVPVPGRVPDPCRRSDGAGQARTGQGLGSVYHRGPRCPPWLILADATTATVSASEAPTNRLATPIGPIRDCRPKRIWGIDPVQPTGPRRHRGSAALGAAGLMLPGPSTRDAAVRCLRPDSAAGVDRDRLPRGWE